MQPDYSRQILLKELGEVGQQRLARSRVLVVGAGGLGSPVLQYLAAAGVGCHENGCLGLVDADVLEASNLHRQPIFELNDVGISKVSLARVAIHKINPQVQVEIHALRFNAANALALVSQYDIVVDCSDNFRTKYLINDAAVLANKPAVFASVYQYEGQLQVYKPQQDHACLRCLWPNATLDGIVGNCAQTGVLGPVPGTFGTLQALLTLKIILNMSGQLAGELLLMDFSTFSMTKLTAKRHTECHAPACARIKALEPDSPTEPTEPNIEVVLPSFKAALAQDFELIDIRDAKEVAAHPSNLRHIPMAALLDNPAQLSMTGQYMLVCATGKRSLATARTLRARGLFVSSFAGGLAALAR